MKRGRALRIFAAVVTLGLSELRWTKTAARDAARKRFASRLLGSATTYSFETPGSLLVISPHPDDETFGCGGFIARKRAAGCEVRVVFLTDGSASHPGHPIFTGGKLSELRAAEATEALKRLGVGPTCIHFLNLPDGRLDRLDLASKAKAQGELRSLAESLHPAEIALPCRFDGSTEHEAGHALAMGALRGLSFETVLLEFPVWAWWSPYRFSGSLQNFERILQADVRPVISQKHSAIAAYASQTKPSHPWLAPVLSKEFVAAFTGPDEFFLQTTLRS